MKKKIFRYISLIISVLIVFTAIPSVFCFAAKINGPVLSIIVSPINDDNISVDIAFDSNPGVGAMTFTVKYDKDCFRTTSAFNKYRRFYSVGLGLAQYLVVDHPDAGYVSFVWADGTNTDLFSKTGVFLTLQFEITDKKAGNHLFEMANVNPLSLGKDLTGCFADFEHNTFSPKVSNGSYYISSSGEICTNHKFTLSKKVDATCTSDGYSTYVCSSCGYTQKRDIVKELGHNFEKTWTVDRYPSKGIAKIISHHCTRCNARTDITYVSEDDSSSKDSSSKDSSSNDSSSKDSSSKKTDDKGGNKDSSKDNTSSKSGGTSSETKKGSDDTSSKESKNGDTKKEDLKKSEEAEKKKEEIVEKIIEKFKIDGNSSKDKKDNDEISADKIIEKIEKEDSEFVGGVEIPKKVKTFGDFLVKASAYLFGVGDEPGIITVVLRAFLDFFI